MKAFKHLLALGCAAWVALFATLAVAQVNVVPQVGVFSNLVTRQTYVGVSVGLVPAASATDIFCISGSASKVVKIQEFRASGVAGTLTSVPFVVLTRTAANTGGTPATGIALPVAGRLDSTNGAATAVLNAWTANPTITDTSPVLIRAGHLTTPTVAAAASVSPTTFTFGAQLSQFNQQLTLRTAASQACVNLQAGSISSGVVNVYVQWTEE